MTIKTHPNKAAVRLIFQAALDKLIILSVKGTDHDASQEIDILRMILRGEADLPITYFGEVARVAETKLSALAQHHRTFSEYELEGLRAVNSLTLPPEIPESAQGHVTDKIKLRLTLDVEYTVDGEDTVSQMSPKLAGRLEDMVREGFGNGVITDDLGAVVDTYDLKVERLHA